MKNITLVGRLTKDAEEVTSVEWPFLKFSIAVDDGYGEKSKPYFLIVITQGSKCSVI